MWTIVSITTITFHLSVSTSIGYQCNFRKQVGMNMECAIKIVTHVNVIKISSFVQIKGIQRRLGLGSGNLISYNCVCTPDNSPPIIVGGTRKNLKDPIPRS